MLMSTTLAHGSDAELRDLHWLKNAHRDLVSFCTEWHKAAWYAHEVASGRCTYVSRCTPTTAPRSGLPLIAENSVLMVKQLLGVIRISFARWLQKKRTTQPQAEVEADLCGCEVAVNKTWAAWEKLAAFGDLYTEIRLPHPARKLPTMWYLKKTKPLHLAHTLDLPGEECTGRQAHQVKKEHPSNPKGAAARNVSTTSYLSPGDYRNDSTTGLPERSMQRAVHSRQADTQSTTHATEAVKTHSWSWTGIWPWFKGPARSTRRNTDRTQPSPSPAVSAIERANKPSGKRSKSKISGGTLGAYVNTMH